LETAAAIVGTSSVNLTDSSPLTVQPTLIWGCGNHQRSVSDPPGIQGNQIVGDLLVEPLDPSWENDYISFKLEIPPEIASDC